MTVDQLLDKYVDLIGYVPAGVEARIRYLTRHDPDYLSEIERTRQRNVDGPSIGPATVQLIMFAILLNARDEDAEAHARIALKAGASKEQLLDVVKIAGWLGGAQAFNLGFRVLQRLDPTNANATDVDASRADADA